MVSPFKWLEALGAGAIVILGIVLLVFPEPSTSIVGGVLIVVGLGLWLLGWRRSKSDSREGVDETATAGQAQN